MNQSGLPMKFNENKFLFGKRAQNTFHKCTGREDKGAQ